MLMNNDVDALTAAVEQQLNLKEQPQQNGRLVSSSSRE
jgi:hypothetical protein